MGKIANKALVILGATIPFVTAFLVDALPKKGESEAEFNKKIKNLAIASFTGGAIAYIASGAVEKEQAMAYRSTAIDTGVAGF